MIGSNEPVLYSKGKDTCLDKEFMKYKRMQLWSGKALEVLTDEETDIMAKLQRKEKLTPRKLTVQDISKLVEFAARIRAYRVAAQREKSRVRMERAREKLRKAAEQGDLFAIRKIENIKKTDRKKNAKYYKEKKRRKSVHS